MKKLDINNLTELFTSISERIINFLPEIIGSLLIIILGWLVAAGIRYLLRKVLQSLNRYIFRNVRFPGIRGVEMEGPLITLIPEVVYWFLILFFVVGAVDTLGLPVFTNWLTKILNFLPLIFIGMIIIIVGVGIGQMCRKIFERLGRSGQIPYGTILGGAVQFLVVLVSIIVAINTLGIDLAFLTTLLGILLAGLLFAAALAFGLGSRDMVHHILSTHFINKIYQVGNQVEINGVKGTILKIQSGFIVIETAEGEVTIPAAQFLKNKSIKSK